MCIPSALLRYEISKKNLLKTVWFACCVVSDKPVHGKKLLTFFLYFLTANNGRSVGLSSYSSYSSSRLHLRRDELSEETLRELDAADRRVKEIENEYWRSLDKQELAIEQKCASGLAKLKMGMMKEAAEDYTAAAELRSGLMLVYMSMGTPSIELTSGLDLRVKRVSIMTA